MRSKTKASIVIIDDEKTVREGIADYLEDAGYSVDSAANGQEGIDLIRRMHPDIILTDLRMPEKGGKEVLESVSREYPDIPVIVISGTGDVGDAIETIHLGASDYIIKPIQDGAILEYAISKALDRARLISENREYRENLEVALRNTESDLRMAINVQRNFLPQSPPANDAWDIAFEFRPMAGVSGDFYDFYMKDGELEGMTLGDVSGHGVASGLITMLAKSIIFRNFINNNDMSLDRILDSINHELIEEIDKVDNYLTGILLRFNEGDAEYVNAAHPPLLVRHGRDGSVSVMGEKPGERNGTFLGIKTLEMKHGVLRFKVEPGDMLLLYSDCLVETQDEDEVIYGVPRLIERFESVDPSMRSGDILKYLLDDFWGFVNVDRGDLPDDLTIIVAKKCI